MRWSVQFTARPRAWPPRPFCSCLSSFLTPSLVVLKTPVAVAAGDSEEGPGLGAAQRGGASATPQFPNHLVLGSRDLALCSPVTLSDWVGRFQEEPAGLCPSLRGSSGPGCGRDRSPGLGGGPGPPRVPGTISSSGRRRDTGRGVVSCVQVRPGEAEGGLAVPRAYSRRPRPRPRSPRSRGLAGARPPPSPRAPALRSASKTLRYRGRGQARGAGRWGPELRVPRARPAHPLCK